MTANANNWGTSIASYEMNTIERNWEMFFWEDDCIYQNKPITKIYKPFTCKVEKKDIRKQYKVEENKVKSESGGTVSICNWSWTWRSSSASMQFYNDPLHMVEQKCEVVTKWNYIHTYMHTYTHIYI